MSVYEWMQSRQTGLQFQLHKASRKIIASELPSIGSIVQDLLQLHGADQLCYLQPVSKFGCNGRHACHALVEAVEAFCQGLDAGLQVLRLCLQEASHLFQNQCWMQNTSRSSGVLVMLHGHNSCQLQCFIRTLLL